MAKIEMNSLKAIDDELEITSNILNAILTKNEIKGMWLPTEYEERSVKWQRGNLNYLIQIFPTIEANQIKRWNFWQVVSADIEDSRYWQSLSPVENGSKKMIIENISSLLSEAITWLSQVKLEKLQFATKLRPI